MAKKLTIPAAIELMADDYNIEIDDMDVYVANGIVYLATSKICELLKVAPHTLSSEYVKPMIKSGVRRVQLGNAKYYCIIEVLTRLNNSIKKDKTFLEICELMAVNRKKKNDSEIHHFSVNVPHVHR